MPQDEENKVQTGGKERPTPLEQDIAWTFRKDIPHFVGMEKVALPHKEPK